MLLNEVFVADGPEADLRPSVSFVFKCASSCVALLDCWLT